MTCSEVRDYLFAFLDNELDASLSIELQRHLERCCHCAREAEIERAIRKQVAHSFEAGTEGIPPFDDVLEKGWLFDRVAPASPEPSRASIRTQSGRRWVMAASLLLIVGSAMWFTIARYRTAATHPALPDLLVKDFQHFVSQGQPLQLASADKESVTQWLHQKTDLSITLPRVDDSRIRLLGGRKCKIEGRPAAFAVYEVNGVPASLVVVDVARRALEGMERVRERGRTHWVNRCKGHTVVACRRGGLIYAAVSTLAEKELLSLMAVD